jgi:hypothetical protein
VRLLRKTPGFTIVATSIAAAGDPLAVLRTE